MACFDQRVLQLLWPALPQFGIAAHASRVCSERRETRHVTVVCLEDSEENFGRLFDYVSIPQFYPYSYNFIDHSLGQCTIYNTSMCPAKPSKEQGPRELLEELLALVRALEPPPKLGGWILLGSILESHRGVDVPPYFRGQGRNVALETFIFFEVSTRASEQLAIILIPGAAYQEAHIPMCLPLVWQIRDNTQEIEISFDQPLTAQIFPSLNRWRGIPRGGRIQFDFFNVKTQTFVPVIRHPLDVPFRLPLPLEFVPVFKISSVTTAAFAEKYSRGTKPLKPMCSMKASFMELKFKWPRGLPHPREYVTTAWRVGIEPWYGEVAKCARFGEPGYSVAAFISEDWPAAEDGGVPEGSAGGDNAPDEDIGIGNRAVQEIEIWEVTADGREIPYVEAGTVEAGERGVHGAVLYH